MFSQSSVRPNIRTLRDYGRTEWKFKSQTQKSTTIVL